LEEPGAGRVPKDSETFRMRKNARVLVRASDAGLARRVRLSIMTDEPDHRRLRNIVDKPFGRRATLNMEPKLSQSPTGSWSSCSRTEVKPM